MEKRDLVPLEGQLNSYSVSAQAVSAAPHDWTKKWAVYAAAAGSALALGTSAGATIIYSGLQNLVANSPSSAIAHINGSSFKLNFANGPFTGSAKLSGPAHLSGANVADLASGNVISSGLGFAAGNHRLRRGTDFGSTHSGNFLSGATGFAGIKAGSDYGWIRLRVDADSHGLPNKITAIDWAYNDTGGAITAGQTTGGATPEPGTASMALLAAGAAGVLAWRRRRKAASVA